MFRVIDRERACILLDEVDNQDLPTNAILRATINSGHHCTGRVSRLIGGELKIFSTFSPLAVAAIGRLPLPIMHRSIVIEMARAPNAELARFDPIAIPTQRSACDAIYRETLAWAQQCRLNLDPPMPKEFRNRAGDNWRVLFAIADQCSAEWAHAARLAAIELTKGRDEDLAVLLLTDIRDIFNRHRIDRGTVGIRPKTIWMLRRDSGTRVSSKGYKRAQFEVAWASYCDTDDTPSQPSNIIILKEP